MRFSRRATIRLAALSAVLVAGALGSAVASAQPAPNQQSASTQFFMGQGLFFGSFNAVSDAGGANPSGEVNYHMGGGFGPNVSATVVCLSVSGNTAVIGFVGTMDGPLQLPQRVVGELVVTDNGPGAIDTLGLSERITDTGTPDCSAPGPVQPQQVTGDIVVHPAAVPTSKDQCKNGGWRNFGDTFKNQGQCVAFVERGPKPTEG
jgi:hypothetical protein